MKTPYQPRFRLSEDNNTATDTTTGEVYDAVEADGKGGCIGCHFFVNQCWDACLNLPCTKDVWENGSRIWRRHQ